jgi:uncharacterized protein HemY
VYAENPPQDNPMKGVMMLVELNKQFPENVSVLAQLGRLAIKTGQWEKAIERLEQALAIEPENSFAVCLLAQAYEGSGNQEQAGIFFAKCEELSSK